LKRERERTVNLFQYSSLGVPDRIALQPFTVPELSMSVFVSFMSVFHRFRPFVTFLRPETVKNGQERPGTFDGLKRLQNPVHGGTFTFTL
jgi:hypothetical protein